MELTTLCYLEKEDQYLMLLLDRKKNDVNKDKWIGIGGHLKGLKVPEECLLQKQRRNRTTLTSYQFRGLVTFYSRMKRLPNIYVCIRQTAGKAR